MGVITVDEEQLCIKIVIKSHQTPRPRGNVPQAPPAEAGDNRKFCTLRVFSPTSFDGWGYGASCCGFESISPTSSSSWRMIPASNVTRRSPSSPSSENFVIGGRTSPTG